MSLQTVDRDTLPGRPLPVGVDALPSRPTWRGASRFGYAVIVLFFVVIGGWAATAPLASGVNAVGEIQADTGVKTIQHLEGGLVKEILVREGDRVAEGDPLLRLDPLHSETLSATHRFALAARLAERARLRAEISGAGAMALDDDLLAAAGDPELAGRVEAETELFESRLDAFRQRVGIREERIAQIETEIGALRNQAATVGEQLDLIEEELADVQQLYEKELTTKSRLLAIRRARTGLAGRKANVEASISQARQRIDEERLVISNMEQERRSDAAERLERLEIEIERSRGALDVAADQRERVVLRAPANGRVVNLAVKTVGAVAESARPLMQIVPDDEAMVLEAEVAANDIEQVKLGATARVRLTAFNPRLTPPVEGIVESVSADTIPSGPGRPAWLPPAYRVVISLDPESLRQSVGDTPLTTGMPASGIIAVGERTLFEYLMDPLTSSFESALREP